MFYVLILIQFLSTSYIGYNNSAVDYISIICELNQEKKYSTEQSINPAPYRKTLKELIQQCTLYFVNYLSRRLNTHQNPKVE